MASSLACRNGHENPNITIFCSTPNCGDWTFLRQSGKPRSTGWRIAILIVAGLLALYLFRNTGDIWAMYAFLTLCLVNLFMVALSRGSALGVVTWSTVLAVMVWVAWSWWGPDDLAGSGSWRWGPVALLAVAITYAVLAGASTTLQTVAVRGTYLVAMLTTVLGLWWTIAVSLDNGLGYTTLFDVAIIVGTTAPLIFVVVAIGRGPNNLAAYLIALSSYLTVAHVIVAALTHAFTNILPDVLRVPRPPDGSEPGWLRILDWKAVISSIGFLGAFVVVLAVSVSTVARRFRAADYSFLQAQINTSIDRQRQATDPFATLVEQTYRNAIKLARVIYLVAVFTAQSAIESARRAYQAVLRVGAAVWSAIRFFVAPVIAVGSAGVILLAVVRDISGYNDGTFTVFSSAELWGGVICVSAVILGLCGISFGFAALAPRTQRLSFNALGASALLGGAFWALISLGNIATWPIWYALRSVDVDIRALSLGPLLWTNNIVMLLLSSILIAVALVSGGIRPQGQVERPRFFVTSLVVSLTLFCTTAIVLGWAPLTHWLAHLSPDGSTLQSADNNGHPTASASAEPNRPTPTQVRDSQGFTADERILRTKLTGTFWTVCTSAPGAESVVVRVVAALSCTTSTVGTDLQPLVMKFATRAALNAYVVAQQITPQPRGSCTSSNWNYDGTWYLIKGVNVGQMICDRRDQYYRIFWSYEYANIGVLAEGKNADALRHWWDDCAASAVAKE